MLLKHTLACIALIDTITYLTTIIGVMRSGFTVFPISPRNSAAAIAHLLSKTSAIHIIVGKEQKFTELVDEALGSLQSNGGEKATGSQASRISVSEMHSYEDYFTAKELPLEDQIPLSLKAEADDVGIILHSSSKCRDLHVDRK